MTESHSIPQPIELKTHEYYYYKGNYNRPLGALCNVLLIALVNQFDSTEQTHLSSVLKKLQPYNLLDTGTSPL